MNRRELLKACAVVPFLGFLKNRREGRQSERFRIKIKPMPHGCFRAEVETALWIVKPRIAEYRGSADELWIVKPRTAQTCWVLFTNPLFYADLASVKYEYIFDLEYREGIMEVTGCEVITPVDRFQLVSKEDIHFIWWELHQKMTPVTAVCGSRRHTGSSVRTVWEKLQKLEVEQV